MPVMVTVTMPITVTAGNEMDGNDGIRGKYGSDIIREFGYTPGKRKRPVVPWDTEHGWYQDHLHFGYTHIPQERWDAIFGGEKKGRS